MANSDKNIIITPQRNLSNKPEITLTGFGNSSVSMVAADGTTGKIDFQNTQTTVFSLDTNLTSGDLFSVSDSNSSPILNISNSSSNIGGNIGKVTIEGEGLVLPSFGTTALPHADEGTLVYDNNHKTAKVYNGSVWVPIGGRKSGLTADTAAESTEQLLSDYPDSPTGFYWILVDNFPYLFWVDMVYAGGGWILVLNNRINTNGMTSLNYDSATKRVINYRGAYGTYALVQNPSQFNLWVGLDAWVKLSNANFSSPNRVCEIVASSYQPLGAVHAHTKRASWNWSGWGASYAWQGLSNALIETGGSMPGLYSYHAANGYNLTTFDVDQDVAGGNCSTSYLNQPNWYGACWSGSPFGGGGSGSHADAWFWDSSTSDYHNYGALYVR